MNSVSTKDEKYRNWSKTNQFRIPKVNEYIASSFGRDLTYNEVTEAYKQAVRETLNENNIEVLQTADSHMTIWCLVHSKDAVNAINILHKAFSVGYTL